MTHCVQASCAIHREPQRPEGASSPRFISHAHLQALSAATSPATCGTGEPSGQTRSRVRGQREGTYHFFLLKPPPTPKKKIKSVWPCGSDMRITSRQACNACVIRQSGGVHTQSWRIKGITRPNIQSTRVRRVRGLWPRTRVCAPRARRGGRLCLWSL